MDAIDVKIIECLKSNSRENASVIGGKVNMSVSAVIERIKKLEAYGIIKQYTVVLDVAKLGMDLTAFIFVSTEHPKFNVMLSDFAAKHPQIIEIHRIIGDFDFLIKVCVSGNKGLQQLIDEIKSVSGVSALKSVVVSSTEKENYSADIIEST